MKGLPVYGAVVPVWLGCNPGYSSVDDSVDRPVVGAWAMQIGGSVAGDEQPCELLGHEDIVYMCLILHVHGL